MDGRIGVLQDDSQTTIGGGRHWGFDLLPMFIDVIGCYYWHFSQLHVNKSVRHELGGRFYQQNSQEIICATSLASIPSFQQSLSSFSLGFQ